jgi:hypothetical protein
MGIVNELAFHLWNMARNDGAGVHRLVRTTPLGKVDVMRVGDIVYVSTWGAGGKAYILKFTFNGNEAELGGETIKVYYYPKKPLTEPCTKIYCLVQDDEETCEEVYCLSKSDREEIIADPEYVMEPGWDESDLIGLAFYPHDTSKEGEPENIKNLLFRLDDIDETKNIRIVLSDKRDNTPEVSSFYNTLLADICTGLGWTVFDQWLDLKFWYKFSQSGEPVIDDEEATESYMPMFEGYDIGYTVNNVPSPDNVNIETTSPSTCGGTPADAWVGQSEYIYRIDNQNQTVSGLSKTMEITLFSGSFQDLVKEAETTDIVFQDHTGNYTPRVVTVAAICPANIYRLQIDNDYHVDERTTVTYEQGTIITPASDVASTTVERPGPSYSGTEKEQSNCSSVISPAWEAMGYHGNIDNVDNKDTTMFSGTMIYATIAGNACLYEFTSAYESNGQRTTFSTVYVTPPGITLSDTGGDVKETKIGKALAIEVVF